MSDIPWLGILDLARAIADKKLSPVEVVKALLARIDSLDGKLKSYTAVFGDSALQAARQAEQAITAGRASGPLHGVPVAVKDLYDVAGTPTTGGSSFLTQPAQRDCTVVAKLRVAGAILLGKLNLHEFAYGPEGINPTFGTAWNPWDAATHRIAGGSSSGSGVAVAAGLAPMGMGSDTGGSIRIPAACCGTVGLKPTYGRVSRAGILPLSWSLDHAGPLTRSVADAAAILNVIAGHDPLDPSSSTLPVPNYLDGLNSPIRGLRVGVVRQYVEQCVPEVQQAIRHTVGVLEGLGCQIEAVTLPEEKHVLAATAVIIGTEAMTYHEPLLRQHAAKYAIDVRRRILAGGLVRGVDYVNAQRARRYIRDQVNAVLGQVDCLLAPTLPVPAEAVGTTEVPLANRTENLRVALTMFTRLFNLSGSPVVALPCGFTSTGLPL